METARDARRRRIVERGSDRLAFITGQTRSLPEPPPPPPPPQSLPQPSPSDAPPNEGDGFASLEAAGDKDDRIELCRELPSEEPSKHEEVNESIRLEPSKHEAANESLRLEPLPKHDSVNESLRSEIRSEMKDEDWHTGERTQVSTFPVSRRSTQPSLQIFTADGISNSVSASENIRLLCAIVIGFLVVLTFSSRSWVGKFVNLRPLFLVLLTDATIVVGHLLMSQRSVRREEDHGWDAGKVLEIGLVVQKALRAAFMDCCICAVIVIAGVGA